MSSISVWVLCIVGIVILSVVVDLIIPTGTTSKFIKNIFAFVIVVVILSPVISFLTNKNVDINDIFTEDSIVIQEEFLSSINQKLLNKIEEDIETQIDELGITNVQIGLKADIFAEILCIEEVSVNLKKAVIDEKAKHINIKTSIIEIIKDKIDILKENIVFYE